eukprot:scaffold24458_cov93-Attheya_sp.AAC.1
MPHNKAMIKSALPHHCCLLINIITTAGDIILILVMELYFNVKNTTRCKKPYPSHNNSTQQEL